MLAIPAQANSQHLNPVQLMLLKMFNRDMSEQEIHEIQSLLLHYLDTKLQKQLDKDIAHKGITQADLDAILNESQRNSAETKPNDIDD